MTEQTERRVRGRIALRLPLVVTGFMPNGAVWCEPTQSEEVSIGGAFFRLSNAVLVGGALHVRAQPSGARGTVDVEAAVVHLSRALFGGVRVGSRGALAQLLLLGIPSGTSRQHARQKASYPQPLGLQRRAAEATENPFHKPLKLSLLVRAGDTGDQTNFTALKVSK